MQLERRWSLREREQPSSRRLAVEALQRIEEGAFANLVLPSLLSSSDLQARDRRFATELVYGTTRMRRACDWMVDRHLTSNVESEIRQCLRLGAYQLVYTRVPPHAAVSATVASTPPRARGLVNAVLRKVSSTLPPEWPNDATRLSYPNWVFDRLRADLGTRLALDCLARMNTAPTVTARSDGYVQDLGSQWVTDLADVEGTTTVADMCAGPGGKSTAMAAKGVRLVVAADLREHRSKLVWENARRLHYPNVASLVADGTASPLRAAAFDRVLVDAPCSGLGVLRRRPDARWRIQPESVGALAKLQLQLLESGAQLVRPGGILVYSVCTMTRQETLEVDRAFEAAHPDWPALPGPGAPWRRAGRGAMLLPQDADTDGMFILRLENARH